MQNATALQACCDVEPNIIGRLWIGRLDEAESVAILLTLTLDCGKPAIDDVINDDDINA
jgi:hypothetical protein